MGLLLSSSLPAEEAWLERSREILESSKQQPMPQWLKEAMQPKADLGDFKRPEAKDLGLSNSPSNTPKGTMTYLFVSQSLGQETLREIVRENRGHKDRVIVFRGLPDGQSLKGFVSGLKFLIEGIDRMELSPITIDPERFARYGITHVPAIVREDDKGVRYTVRGSHEVAWLDRQIPLSPGSRDFGQRGETVLVSEPDLLEHVKERARRFDWAGYKKEAQARFWKEVRFETLPEAKADREFWVDPTFTVPRDLKDTRGHLIAFPGQRVNPLKTLPFHQKLLVFNGTRAAQVDRVSLEIKKETPYRVTLITTEVNPQSGWDGLLLLEKRLGARVFLMNPALRKCFKLEATPAIVEAVNHQFRVRELGMERGG